MGIFQNLKDGATAAWVAQHVEPMLNSIEMRQMLDDSRARIARCKSAKVLAEEPALFGFLWGTISYLILARHRGNVASDRARQVASQTLCLLFPKDGYETLARALQFNGTREDFKDGFRKGTNAVAYSYGADYSGDPAALAAIQSGRTAEELATDCGLTVMDPGSEQGAVVGGMQLIYFTLPFLASYRKSP